jgi:hypothetical protein
MSALARKLKLFHFFSEKKMESHRTGTKLQLDSNRPENNSDIKDRNADSEIKDRPGVGVIKLFSA